MTRGETDGVRHPDVPADLVTARARHVRESLESGRSVVVRGAAGVGKTHLLNRALRDVTSARVVVLPVPARARGPASADPAADGSRGSPTDTAAAAAAALGTGRVILRLEDAHLLDDASARAVQRLVRRAGAALAVTTRTPARVDPDPVPDLDPGAVEVVDLEPLDVAGVGHLLRWLLGGPVTAETTYRLWAETGGNVLHLRELVRDQREREALRAHDGVWVWTGTASVVPRALDVALHDLDGLDAHERAALELAALAGPLPVRTLDRVATPEAVRALLHRGLLHAHGDGPPTAPDAVVGTTNGLWADAVWSVTATERRREVVRAVWEPADGAADEVSDHRTVARALDLGVVPPLARVLGAVDAALVGHDPARALDIADGALRHGSWRGPPLAELLAARAEAWLYQGQPAVALQDASSAASAARAAIENDERDDAADAAAAAAAHRIDVYLRATRLEAVLAHLAADDADPALAVLERARTWLADAAHGGGRPRALAELDACRLAHLGYAGRHAATLDAAVRLLRRGTSPALAALAVPTVLGLALAGRHADLEPLCSAHLIAHPDVSGGPRRGPDRWTNGSLAVALFLARLQAGDVAGAAAAGERMDAAVGRTSAHLRRGLLEAAQGRWQHARDELHAATARARARDPFGALALALAAEACATAAAGDGPRARELLAELGRTSRRFAGVVRPLLDLMVVDALAWLRDPRAAGHAAALADRSRRDGLCASELEALHRTAVLGAGDPHARTRLDELAERVGTRRAAALARHARALRERSGALEDAEAELRRYGVWLPPAVTAAATLTRREREVATLAAGGMTSRAIAQRLTLSVRTVDSHLSRAYAKLRVHTREDLASALAPPHPGPR